MMRRLLLLVLVLAGASMARAVRVRPDVFNVVMPPNIAPFNVDVTETSPGAAIRLAYRAPNGDELAATGAKIRFPIGAWHAFLGAHPGESLTVTLDVDGKNLLTATNTVAREPIDSHLTYRLIQPGYAGHNRIGIYQRELATFKETPVYRNDQSENRQCMNCHTYNQGKADTWMFHVRYHDAGTIVHSPKYGFYKVDLSVPGLYGGCTYPAWHPSGDFITFSVNETRQHFYESRVNKVEVFDVSSDLVHYSLKDQTITTIESDPSRFECYPTWSPDGRWLYTTARRTPWQTLPTAVKDREHLVVVTTTNACYDLVRRGYDPATRRFSPPETLVDGPANNLSVTLPRVSPDGRWLVFSGASYGINLLWHPDSDIWIVDVTEGRVRRANEINSAGPESYFCFSTTGRWCVFSSRRDDGCYTRPYIAAFDARTGQFSKPFLLPFESPADHDARMQSFNIPEFSNGPVSVTPRQLGKLIPQAPVRTKFVK